MSKIIVSICVVFLIINMTCMPSFFTESGAEAVNICLNSVIPSLFPFFICSGLLIALGFAKQAGKLLAPIISPIFNIPGSGAIAFVIGILSGYPIGAKCAVDLYKNGEASLEEAERMIAFCNNSGPMFILGVVGAMFLQSEHLGRVLYLSHIFSAILVGVLFRFYKYKEKTFTNSIVTFQNNDNKNIGLTIGDVITSSVDTMLKVCGFVVIFYILGKSLSGFENSELFFGLIEMTSGIAMLSGIVLDPIFKLCLISFFISFSGISVLLQVSSIVTPAGLSMKPYFIGKSLQGVISSVITYFICLKCPETVSVFADNEAAGYIDLSAMSWLKVSLAMVGWCVLCIAVICLIALICEKLNKK